MAEGLYKFYANAGRKWQIYPQPLIVQYKRKPIHYYQRAIILHLCLDGMTKIRSWRNWANVNLNVEHLKKKKWPRPVFQPKAKSISWGSPFKASRSGRAVRYRINGLRVTVRSLCLLVGSLQLPESLVGFLLQAAHLQLMHLQIFLPSAL
jgi:hypothetical protein